MDISILETLIGEYTFPILAFFLMYKMVIGTQRSLIEAVNQLTVAIKTIDKRLDILSAQKEESK